MKLLKFKRGQIWWYKMVSSFDGSVQGKTRPVVIISNDLANANSKCLIGIPCTTSIKRYMPTHIDIDINGTPSTILAENMMSLNIDKLVDYIGTLDDELLEKVEKCMKIAIGLEASTPIKRAVVHRLSDSEISKNDNEVDNQDKGVYKLSQKGQELMKEVQKMALNKRRTRIKWTKESMQDYINNYKIFGIDYCVKLYKEKNQKAVRNKLYVFKKKLEKENI